MKTKPQSPIAAAMMKAHADILDTSHVSQSVARAIAEQQRAIRDMYARCANSDAIYANLAAAESSVRSLHEVIGRSVSESIARAMADHQFARQAAFLRESAVQKVAQALLERETNFGQGAVLFRAQHHGTVLPASAIGSENQTSPPAAEPDTRKQEPAESLLEIGIEMPPGTHMMAWARAMFLSKKTIEFVFEPIVADYQYEIFEALKNKQDEQTLRTIRVRCWMAFLVAVVCQLASGIGKIIKAWKGA